MVLPVQFLAGAQGLKVSSIQPNLLTNTEYGGGLSVAVSSIGVACLTTIPRPPCGLGT